MTTNSRQVNGSAARHQARAWGNREGSCTTHTTNATPGMRASMAELEAEIEAVMVAAMGADGWQAFQNAPCAIETMRAAGRHVGVIQHGAGVAG